ncbi:MAG: hypothetical protein V4502_06155 [Pseudomonadota bacterium]
MNRRGFLASIAAALVLDPERALWVPGRKLISVPAPRVTGCPICQLFRFAGPCPMPAAWVGLVRSAPLWPHPQPLWPHPQPGEGLVLVDTHGTQRTISIRV